MIAVSTLTHLAECLIINFEVIVMITGKIVGSSAIQVAIEREVEVYKGIIVIKSI